MIFCLLELEDAQAKPHPRQVLFPWAGSTSAPKQPSEVSRFRNLVSYKVIDQRARE